MLLHLKLINLTLVFVCAISTAPCTKPVAAQFINESRFEPNWAATRWLHESDKWIQQFPDDRWPDATHRIDAPGVLMFMLLSEHRLEREETTQRHFDKLQELVNLNTRISDSPWAAIYLVGPLITLDHQDKAESIISSMPSMVDRLDARQLILETHRFNKQPLLYNQAIESMWEQLAITQAAEVARTEAEPSESFSGLQSAPYIFRTLRDAGDKPNTRRFAGFKWQEPSDRSLALSSTAQLEWLEGNTDMATRLCEGAKILLKQSVQRSHESDSSYLPELGPAMRELFVATWLTNGREAAELLEEEIGELTPIDKQVMLAPNAWRTERYLSAATMLQRAGRESEAKEAFAVAAQMCRPPDFVDEMTQLLMLELCRVAGELQAQEEVRWIFQIPEDALEAESGHLYLAAASLGLGLAELDPASAKDDL